MVYVPVQCPYCHGTEVIKAGKQANGAQRYRCQNDQCARGGSFSCSTRIAADLNLSDAQKAQLKTALETAREKNPNLTRADVLAKLIAERSTVRERVVKFFTPEQLAKWDAEVAKAKTFLGLAVNE